MMENKNVEVNEEVVIVEVVEMTDQYGETEEWSAGDIYDLDEYCNELRAENKENKSIRKKQAEVISFLLTKIKKEDLNDTLLRMKLEEEEEEEVKKEDRMDNTIKVMDEFGDYHTYNRDEIEEIIADYEDLIIENSITQGHNKLLRELVENFKELRELTKKIEIEKEELKLGTKENIEVSKQIIEFIESKMKK